MDHKKVTLMQKLGEIVANFSIPPHPSGISMEGKFVKLSPLITDEFALDLFRANSADKKNENWTYLPYGPFLSLDEYTRWIKSLESKNDPVFFAIINKNSNKAVGLASYLRINREHASIEVGHINFSPLLQKTTPATEAMYLMMKWVFDNGYRRYEWKCNSLNLKSRRAAQRLGFSYEGIFRQMNISKGRNRDTAWYAVIDKEWKEIKKSYLTFLSKENFDKSGRAKVSLSSLTKPLLYKTDNCG